MFASTAARMPGSATPAVCLRQGPSKRSSATPRVPALSEVVTTYRKALRSPATATLAVDVWAVAKGDDIWLANHVAVLTDSERKEYARIRASTRRWRAMSARILLRLALSEAVGGSVAPGAWRFRTGPQGKPEVADGLPAVHFSVSYTELMAVVAVCRTRPVGVDVEALDQAVGEELISTFLSPAELRVLDRTDSCERAREFLRFWTLKEAYTKLLGIGLSADFAAITFDAQEPILRASGGRDAAAHFETFAVRPAAGACRVSLAIGAERDRPIACELRLRLLDKTEEEDGPRA